MKKLILALAVSALALQSTIVLAVEEVVLDENGNRPTVSSYDEETRVVYIPTVNFEGAPLLSDLMLKFREDGLFEFVGYRGYESSTDYVEVCAATAGVEAFTVEDGFFEVGNVFTNTDGRLIIITGTRASFCDKCGVSIDDEWPRKTTFSVAPSGLPGPYHGTKGRFYVVGDGDIAYADFLSQDAKDADNVVYLDRVVEKIVYQDRVVEVPVEKIVYQDVIKYVDKIVYRDKIVEVPAGWPVLAPGETERLAFTDTIQFDNHGVGGIFKRGNGELWIIIGSTRYGLMVSSATSAIISDFYYTFDSLPEPGYGEKSDYYFWDDRYIYYVAPL